MKQPQFNQKKSLKTLSLGLVVFMVIPLLNACVPALISTATVTAIDLYHERRTLKQNIDDNSLELRLRADMLNDDSLGNAINVSVVVINGIVLLTGEVHNDNQRKRAEKIAHSYNDTRKVVNELALSGQTNLNSRVNDSYITSKVKTKLVRADNVPATNIKVVTERGQVYLMGLVTHAEADNAVEIAKSVSGVTHIIKVFEYIDN